MAVEHARAAGTHVEVVRHNSISVLDKRLDELSTRYQRVWYPADGIYSMFGDTAPLEDLKHLLRRYHNLYLYLGSHALSTFYAPGKKKERKTLSQHTPFRTTQDIGQLEFLCFEIAMI